MDVTNQGYNLWLHGDKVCIYGDGHFMWRWFQPDASLSFDADSNHMTPSKRVDTLICHTTMRRHSINFLYNPGHMTIWCLEVVLVVYAGVSFDAAFLTLKYYHYNHSAYCPFFGVLL